MIVSTPHNEWMRSISLRIFSLISIAGCAEELGPVVSKTATVEGRITVAGRPVVGGFVEFLPIEGAIGKLRSAQIRSDGSFKADRVAVGKNGIRVIGFKPYDPRFHVLTQKHLIHRPVSERGMAGMRIDLLVELSRVDAERDRSR
jgi:hypothetical protein